MNKKKEQMEKIKDKKAAFLIDSSVLQNMFEGKNEGKAGEVLQKLKTMKDNGMEVKTITPMSSFLRAIFLSDPKVTINDIQKTMSFLDIMPSLADFKDEKAVLKEVIRVAKMMSGKPLTEQMIKDEKKDLEKIHEN